MKIRKGFVSNSSSSSYTVIMKGELTGENFLGALELQEGSPLYSAYKKLFDYCINSKWGWLVTNEEEFFKALEEKYHINKEDIQPGGDYYSNGEWLNRLEMIRAGYTMFNVLLSYNECELEIQYGGMLRSISDSDHICVAHEE